MRKPKLQAVNGKNKPGELTDSEMIKFAAWLDTQADSLRKAGKEARKADGMLPQVPMLQAKNAASCETVSQMLKLLVNREIDLEI